MYVILPLQNVDGVVKGGDNNGKYASMIFANETWNKLGEMGLHDLVFLWPNVNAHGTWKIKIKNVIFCEKYGSIYLFQNSNIAIIRSKEKQNPYDLISKLYICISNRLLWPIWKTAVIKAFWIFVCFNLLSLVFSFML